MSEAQYMPALENGNRIRLDRAELKRRLKARSVTLSEAISDDCVQTMKLTALLGAQCRWGDHKVAAAMRLSRIPGNPRVCDLTEVQRDALIRVSTNVA